MITLTLIGEGGECLVNESNIVFCQREENATRITLMGSVYEIGVIETPDQILEKIKRAKPPGPEIIQEAIKLGVEYGGINGSHHKTWVIDQMIRILAQDRYEQIVTDFKAGEDGPNTYDWDEGIAP